MRRKLRVVSVLSIGVAAMLAMLAWQAPASWLTSWINTQHPVLGIANASGTWYNGSGHLVWRGTSPRTLGQLQWTLGWNSADVRLNGTAIALHRAPSHGFSATWTTPIVLNPLQWGTRVQWTTVATINPGTWSSNSSDTSTLSGELTRNQLNLTKGLQRSFPSIRWTQQGKTIALQGGGGLQGSISPNPWTLTLSTPFRPGDGIYESLTVLLGRPASTLTIPLQ